MAIETPPQVSKLMTAVAQASKRALKFLGRVFKPGGWRYLRPVETEQKFEHDEPEMEKRRAA